MKKKEQVLQKYKSLTEAISESGLPAPQHPLIALINSIDKPLQGKPPRHRHVLNFYKITYRPSMGGTLKYGQSNFKFNNGGMFFAAPDQIIGSNDEEPELKPKKILTGQITLLIHPDFFLAYPLATKIKQYCFFSYSTNEALHLLKNEKETILSIFRTIEAELEKNIDDFSQDILIAQIELLLIYSNRFYKRQFIKRKKENHEILDKVDEYLEGYFNTHKSTIKGLPSVQRLAKHVNISPGYLSDLLRSSTGQNAQQIIHTKLIEKAKIKLSSTELSVSEIAYELGFEHSQSFSKLFKSKTKLSPLEFRQSFT